MPGLKAFQDFVVSETADRRAQTWWAAGAVIVVAVLIAVTSILYLHPLGRANYHAVMDESGGIAAGTDVRVAGIVVGKVTAVSLNGDEVDVTMAVKSSVQLGDQTSLAVRMLTVVGGSYVALLPSGSKPLGHTAIPANRTSVPYSTAEVLNQAAHVVQGMDGNTLRNTTITVTDSLNSAPGAIRSIAANVATLTDLLNRQQQQLQSVANIGAEYSGRLAGARDTLQGFLLRTQRLLPLLIGYKDRGIITFDALDTLVNYFGDILGKPYQTTIKPPLYQLLATAQQTKNVTGRMNDGITQLRQIIDQISRVLYPNGATLDFGQQVASGTGICIPIAGRRC